MLSALWLLAAGIAVLRRRHLGAVTGFWLVSVLFANWIILPFGVSAYLPATMILLLAVVLRPAAVTGAGGLRWLAAFSLAMGAALVAAEFEGTGFGAPWIVQVLLVPSGLAWLLSRRTLGEAEARAVLRAFVAAFLVEAALIAAQQATGGLGLFEGIGRTEDSILREEPRGYLAYVLPGLVDPMVVRARGSLATGNYAGQFMDLGLPIGLAGLMGAPDAAARRNWLLAFGALLAGTMLTYSRGSLAGLAVAALVMSLRVAGASSAARRWLRRLAIAAVAVAVMQVGRTMVAALEDATGVSSVSERQAIWLATLAVSLQSPRTVLAGLGPRGYQELATVSVLEELQGRVEVFGHNGLVVQVAEYGLPSAALLVAMLVAWGRGVWRAYPAVSTPAQRQLLLGCMGVAAAVWSHQMVDHAWGDHAFRSIFFAVLGVGWSIAGGAARGGDVEGPASATSGGAR